MALKKEEEKELLSTCKQRKEELSPDKFKSWARGVLTPGGHSDKFEEELNKLVEMENRDGDV